MLPSKDFLNKLNPRQVMLIFLMGVFVLYGNTLNHDYALDDAIVISKNAFTQQGIRGIPDILAYDSFTGFFGKEKQLVDGGRYRPLSLITFAMEYQLFGALPMMGHLINILVYFLVVWILYRLMRALLSVKLGEGAAHQLAFLTSLLFMLHPIHTEVVANIKGRDELLSVLFSLLAFQTALRFLKNKNGYLLALAGIFLFLGLMSKENAIAFVFIIPVAFVYFHEVSRKQLVALIASLSGASFLFLFIRYQVLGGFQQQVASELMNNPFIHATGAEKMATVLYTWFIYFKLLLFPHPLTFDYYPKHIPLVNFSNPFVLISMVMVLLLAGLAMVGMKRKSIVSFSVLAFAASFSMVSNLLFSVGTFMNERFVFMPSVFWCLAISYLGWHYYIQGKQLAKTIILLGSVYLLTFYPIKTVTRNKAWKNDLTLFTTDVKTSAQSAKSNCSAGGKLWEEGKLELDAGKRETYYAQSEVYLRRAVAIHPDYVDAWLLLGNLLFDAKKDIEGSVGCYLEVVKRQAGNPNAWKNADIVLQQSPNRDLQLALYQQLYRYHKNSYTLNYRLGVLHGRYFGDLPKGLPFLKRAVAIDPQKIEALKDLGTAYGIMGQDTLAYEVCKKALELDKTDPQIYINLGIAASKLGMQAASADYFKQAETLKKEIK